MIQNSSFRLANALLGLLVIILPFLGLPGTYKTVLFITFGSLIILFSLAEVGRHEAGEYGNTVKNDREPENHVTN